MGATLEAMPLDAATRAALKQFFEHTSSYVIGGESAGPENGELAERWSEQCTLDEVIAAIRAGRDQEAINLAPRFQSRPAVFAGVLARMLQSGRAPLVRFVADAVEHDRSLASRRFTGQTLLHCAAGAGCLPVLDLLLRCGAAADIRDSGGHTPLYSVANECGIWTGPEVVQALVRAGADVNACGGVTRATALHMAARRGHVAIARALLDCGAAIGARDYKGVTPLERAVNCRKSEVANLLISCGAAQAGGQRSRERRSNAKRKRTG
jgi:hypothetical protein